MTEGEKTPEETDLRVLASLSDCVSHSDPRIAELALRQVTVFCENNPNVVLLEFENKAQGIVHCMEAYIKAPSPTLV